MFRFPVMSQTGGLLGATVVLHELEHVPLEMETE
jgi:hypothetical protein